MSSDDPSPAARGGTPPFTCGWGRQGLDAASVQVTGRLDAASSPKLDAVIDAALRDARLVLMNLRLVSFLDTTGVAVIVGASTRARNAGRCLLVVGVAAAGRGVAGAWPPPAATSSGYWPRRGQPPGG
jgi:anti-anti-sigma factor